MSRNKSRTIKRRWRKSVAVKLLGGACSVCGYSECLDALDLHHIEPHDKEHDMRTMRDLSEQKFWEEVLKCNLVCANCHRELHAGESK